MDQNTLLLLNALALGLRHGLDWDHLAAILDIVNTTMLEDGKASSRRRPLTLALLYALGHASVIAVLGCGALCFASVLPAWIDPVMERVVGGTLIVLGMWLGYTLVGYLQNTEQITLQSRGQVIMTLLKSGTSLMVRRPATVPDSRTYPMRQYGTGTALGVGIVHGIGAETGTQVLLLAAVGGASTQSTGLIMLAAFIVGLLFSNSLVALSSTLCLTTSARFRPLYIGTAIFTCASSVLLGVRFILGH